MLRRQVWGGVGAGFGCDDQDRQDSGLSPDLCDGIVGRVLLHLRDPDALVELLQGLLHLEGRGAVEGEGWREREREVGVKNTR